MKVLYAIQGKGMEHLNRARQIIPILQKHAIELDILVSGTCDKLTLPHPIKYQFTGWSFISGKKGGVDVWKTFLRTNATRLQNEIRSIPVSAYDLIINDFEPVSAWACQLENKACISFSHQAALSSELVPIPKKNDRLGKLILKKYAPGTKAFGLHFKAYDRNIYTPIIRQEVRSSTPIKGQSYTVYLPFYNDSRILNVLSNIRHIEWNVFSQRTDTNYFWKNIAIRKMDDEAFTNSMIASKGILCGAGFEIPAEALHMGKKLMVIPMKGQYEHKCNAAALSDIGVPVIKSLKIKHLSKIKNWVNSESKIEIYYPDITNTIVEQILQEAPVGSVC